MLGLAGSERLGYFWKIKAVKYSRIFCQPLLFEWGYGLGRGGKVTSSVEDYRRGYHGYLFAKLLCDNLNALKDSITLRLHIIEIVLASQTFEWTPS